MCISHIIMLPTLYSAVYQLYLMKLEKNDKPSLGVFK